MKKGLCLSALIFLMLFSVTLFAKVKPNVLLVNPSIRSDPFWHKIENITRQAAKDLQLNLSVIYGDGTRYFQLSEIKTYLQNNKKPDYAILINYPGSAKVTMDYLQNQQIKVITLEQTLSGKEKQLLKQPGELYKNWLGEIYFENKSAGELLANSLFKQAKAANNALIVAGINGHYGSESTLRSDGLKIAIAKNKAKLTQIVHAGWSAEDAYHKTLKLIQRYPDIAIIWCASDHMALGALKAVKELGLTPGEDIFIGGFDWITPALKSIKQQQLNASVGGHFIMGALAVLAIYYEEEKYTNNPILSVKHSHFQLSLLTKENIGEYEYLINDFDLTKVDFKKLALTSQQKINLFAQIKEQYIEIK